MQTLTFGQITLVVDRNSTISMVRRKIRCKIDDMFLRIGDVELIKDFEGTVHGLVFEGKILNDECTLAYYKIQQDATVRMTSTLDGGGTYVSFCYISFHF